MNYDSDDEFDGPSKSQRKREAHQQQDLGIRLTECREAHLQQVDLPDVLRTAIGEFKRLPNKHGARRRQLQFIGKLMRDCDCDAISSALDRLENFQPAAPKGPSPAQVWSDRILDDGDEAITALLEENPALERQKLRQLYRDFHAAAEDSRDKHREKLQRYLAPLLSAKSR